MLGRPAAHVKLQQTIMRTKISKRKNKNNNNKVETKRVNENVPLVNSLLYSTSKESHNDKKRIRAKFAKWCQTQLLENRVVNDEDSKWPS